MGSTSSSLSELSDNVYLQQLCGTAPVTEVDPYWNQLLSFHIQPPLNVADSRLLEESVAGLCKSLAINNCKTGNFGALVRVFLMRASQLRDDTACESEVLVWQTYNALFIIRTVCKYFIEHLSEEVIIQEFEAKNTRQDVGAAEEGGSSEGIVEDLVTAAVELVIDVPIRDVSYALHLECVNLLLTLLAMQMFQPKPVAESAVYRYVMNGKCSMHACLLTKRLLLHYIQQFRAPASLLAVVPESSSMWSSVTAGLWSMMSKGLGSAEASRADTEQDTHLANQSLLLLLLLVNYCVTEHLHNPYRQALFSFTDSKDDTAVPDDSEVRFAVDYSSLMETLCRCVSSDQSTLLLYVLLHRNQHFRAYVLSRSNIDALVVPLLQVLYTAENRNSHHIYMSLIVLLILSEDDYFSKAVHEITVKQLPWLRERQLTEVSLGGLIILVVIRTIQYNMTRMRDKYLHTNCLAALANLSAQFRHLHSHVSQRLVGLFNLLCKRHSKLVNAIREAALARDPETEQDMSADLSVLEEVLRMVLEIINSALCSALHLNPNLVYALLYHKAVFDPFRTHPAFQDIIQNIDMVLGFFSERVEAQGKGSSVDLVLKTIHESSLHFKRDRLKKFPELRFQYVEEDEPEEFFIPYVWSLVYHSSNMFFTAQRIQLFSLST